MINGKTILAIITARGGSKGLPGKNIKSLCGKPLITWSIEAGLASKYVDEVMVSTDSEEIADVARHAGASIPYIRPAELATDTATSIDVLKHALTFYENTYNRYYDYIVLLEPTSPLREENDIDNMLDKIIDLEKEFDAIVSIGEVHEHPSIMKKIVNKEIREYCDELVVTSRRQDNDRAFFPYGVAYIVKRKTLLEENTIYPRHTTYHIIKRYQCYEIDDLYDFLAIENIMRHEWNLR